MGAPVSGLNAAEDKTAEALLSAFKHMEATERRKHATVFNYWLSIRRERELPPIRDLDPLEISDLAPCSLLIELVDGGADAEMRHLGEKLHGAAQISKLSEAESPSVLSCVAGKLGTVAASRDALAFEDMFEAADGSTRCSVTLLPFSMSGDAVDFIYAFVTVETGVSEIEEAPEPVPDEEPAGEAKTAVDCVAEEPETAAEPIEAAAEEPQAVEAGAAEEESEREPEAAGAEPLATDEEAKPGFSKIFDALAGAKGFFGTVASAEGEPATQPAVDDDIPEEAEPVFEEAEPVAEEPERVPVAEEPAPLPEEPAPPIEDQVSDHIPAATEGSLQIKLADVRSKADEARAAKVRAEAALIEGLSAAYDFALDAEDAPEEYLKLVEGQGLKIQLRSPMKPVVKLAFDGTCDEATIKDLEAVLAWALKMDLPRGALAERVEAEGGISAILNGQKRAA